MKYTTILLDADGTLLDFAAAQEAALFRALDQLGIQADSKALTCYDQINHAQWKRLERGEVTRTAMLVERFEKLAQQCGYCYDAKQANRLYSTALGESAQMIDGADALLRTLGAVASLAIVTNGVAKTQHRRFALSGIDQLVGHIFISGELGYEKPDPRFFEVALKQCRVADPRTVLVVGDSLTADIAGAEAAGIDSCWYNPEGAPVPKSPHPTYIVQTLKQVIELVLG